MGYEDESKKGKIKKIILGVVALLLLALIAFVIIYFTLSSKEILGTCVSRDNNNYVYIFKWNKKGIAVAYFNDKEFSYKTDDDKLKITYKESKKTYEYSYRIVKDKLLITDSSGKQYVYVKQK